MDESLLIGLAVIIIAFKVLDPIVLSLLGASKKKS